jgi:hypothetical protein
MGALLNANSIHNKSSDMRSIMDSLTFAMEDMSRSLRTGYNYYCLDYSNGDKGDKSCSGGGSEISFQAVNPTLSEISYYFGTCDFQEKSICKAVKDEEGNYGFDPITPLEVEIDASKSSFIVIGAEPPPGNSQQPLVTIRLVGEINYKNTKTPFSLQTSVSQRNIDI